MAFVTPVVEHWLEWEKAHWVHPMKDLSDNPSHHERTLLPRSYKKKKKKKKKNKHTHKNPTHLYESTLAWNYQNVLLFFMLKCFTDVFH